MWSSDIGYREIYPKHIYPNKRKSKITAFIVDGTQIQIGSNQAWLWVATEPIHKRILGIYISRHRNILVETFKWSLIELYGKHIVYTD
jgi:transposase-like protein